MDFNVYMLVLSCARWPLPDRQERSRVGEIFLKLCEAYEAKTAPASSPAIHAKRLHGFRRAVLVRDITAVCCHLFQDFPLIEYLRTFYMLKSMLTSVQNK